MARNHGACRAAATVRHPKCGILSKVVHALSGETRRGGHALRGNPPQHAASTGRAKRTARPPPEAPNLGEDDAGRRALKPWLRHPVPCGDSVKQPPAQPGSRGGAPRGRATRGTPHKPVRRLPTAARRGSGAQRRPPAATVEGHPTLVAAAAHRPQPPHLRSLRLSPPSFKVSNSESDSFFLDWCICRSSNSL